MKKFMTLLLGVILAFNINAGHDIEQQILESNEPINKTCTEYFKGIGLKLENDMYFCESDKKVIFYFYITNWNTCIAIATLYSSAVDKQPGCFLIVPDNSYVDEANSLKAKFMGLGVELYVFNLELKYEHDKKT
jgi:hypothetical protein